MPPTHDSVSRLSRRRLPGLLLLLGAGLLAGCANLPTPFAKAHPAPAGYTPRNFMGDALLPATIRRVLVLPVCGGQVASPESTAALDPVVRDALQKQARFEVVMLSREDCRHRYGAPEFSSAGALPHGFMEDLGRAYAADALLFVDLTAFRDQRPLALGVRARLVAVAGPRVVWSFDEIVSGADPAVGRSALLHARAGNRSDLPLDTSYRVLQSPSEFAAYVADTVFGTLPPR
jgi:hypothetical protein